MAPIVEHSVSVNMEVDRTNTIFGDRNVHWRPSFSPKVLRDEQEANELIATALMKYGCQTAAELFDSIDQSCRKTRWATISDLEYFIRHRSHIFTFSAISKTISNRGFGYMRGMILLVTYVCDINETRTCTLDDLFKLVSKLPHYTYDMPWKDKHVFEEAPKTPDELRLLLERDHKNVFVFFGDSVNLTKEISLICSYWNPKGLVRRPPDYNPNPQNKDISYNYSDRSRMFSFYVYIITRTDIYLKGIIESGTYVNRSVYILGKNVGLTNAEGLSAIPEDFAIGTRAVVTAWFSLNCACNFTATTIMADGKLPQIWFQEICEPFTQVFQQEFIGEVHSSCLEEKTMDYEDLNTGICTIIKEAVKLEYERQIFSDKLFTGNGKADIEDLINLYQKLGDSPFRSQAEFQNFLSTRKHLYHKFEEEAYPLYQKRTEADREGFCQLFELLKLKECNNGTSWQKLSDLIQEKSASFPALPNLLAQNKLQTIYDNYYFEIVKPRDELGDELLFLHGVYSTERRCFVSGYDRSYNTYF